MYGAMGSTQVLLQGAVLLCCYASSQAVLQVMLHVSSAAAVQLLGWCGPHVQQFAAASTAAMQAAIPLHL